MRVSGKSKAGDPDGAFAGRDIAALAGHAEFDGSDHLVGFGIDAGNRAVALVQDPDGVFPDREEARFRAGLDGFGDQVGRGSTRETTFFPVLVTQSASSPRPGRMIPVAAR